MKHTKTVGVMLLASAMFFILLDANYTFSTHMQPELPL